jgi:hypothetical protein
MARQLWKNEGFYAVISEIDNALQKAEDLMRTNQVAEASSSGKLPQIQKR